MFTQEERRITLVALREQLRLKQLDVAKACRINRTSLCLWEHGNANLPAENLDAIEAYLTDELSKLQALGDHERVCIPLSGLLERRPELDN
jgi:transcriptional regulator with XRE-family HTH domain